MNMAVAANVRNGSKTVTATLGGKLTLRFATPVRRFSLDSIMATSEPELVYAFLPEPLGPIDRGDKYEDPIIDELTPLGLGEVSGGGSSLGDPLPDGTRPIEFCGIDIDTSDVEATREALRALLAKLGCLKGTQLHYRVADIPLQDEYNGASWILDQDRTMLHPGFGV